MSDIQSDLRRGADERDGEPGQPQDHEGDQGAQTLQTSGSGDLITDSCYSGDDCRGGQ